MKEKINPEKGYKTKHMNLQLFGSSLPEPDPGPSAPVPVPVPEEPGAYVNIYSNDGTELLFKFNTAGLVPGQEGWVTVYFDAYYRSEDPGHGSIDWQGPGIYWYNWGFETPEYILSGDEIGFSLQPNSDTLIEDGYTIHLSDSVSNFNLYVVESAETGYSSTITLTNCRCTKSSETGLSGSYSATVTADNGYYLSSVISSLGTVTIAENKKTAEITISDVTENFTIDATGTTVVKKTIIMHPNDNGITDYTTKVYPTLNKASSDDIDDIFFGSWEAPTQEGEDLSLSQAYSATQNGDTLTFE